MSGYSGRRAPNFSQYLNDLNTPPPPFYDQSTTTTTGTGQQQQDQDLFDVDAELAMFTNAEFLDFDAVGRDLSNNMPHGFDHTEQPHQDRDHANDDPSSKYMDMLNDVKIPDFQYYQSPMLSMQQQHSSYPPSAPQLQATNSQQDVVGGHSAIQPAPTPGQTQAPPATPVSTTAQSPASGSANQNSNAGSKRKQDPSALDDGARMAQEEDKRRRNTAASARFRIKKKEREKNLERTVKDVTTKNATLEARINQLELENRWLKNLVTEKNGSSFSDGDLSGLFSKFRQSPEGQKQQQQTSEQTQSS